MGAGVTLADLLAEAVARPASRRSELRGSRLLVLGPDGAQQLAGAAFADPGRGGDVAGVQADASGALGGDQLSHSGAAVARRAAAVAAGGGVLGAGSCGRSTAVAVGSRSPLWSSAAWMRSVRGRPVRATLISSSKAPRRATGGRAANSVAGL
jgi:hypothetical protein